MRPIHRRLSDEPPILHSLLLSRPLLTALCTQITPDFAALLLRKSLSSVPQKLEERVAVWIVVSATVSFPPRTSHMQQRSMLS